MNATSPHAAHRLASVGDAVQGDFRGGGAAGPGHGDAFVVGRGTGGACVWAPAFGGETSPPGNARPEGWWRGREERSVIICRRSGASCRPCARQDGTGRSHLFGGGGQHGDEVAPVAGAVQVLLDGLLLVRGDQRFETLQDAAAAGVLLEAGQHLLLAPGSRRRTPSPEEGGAGAGALLVLDAATRCPFGAKTPKAIAAGPRGFARIWPSGHALSSARGRRQGTRSRQASAAAFAAPGRRPPCPGSASSPAPRGT